MRIVTQIGRTSLKVKFEAIVMHFDISLENSIFTLTFKT